MKYLTEFVILWVWENLSNNNYVVYTIVNYIILYAIKYYTKNIYINTIKYYTIYKLNITSILKNSNQF